MKGRKRGGGGLMALYRRSHPQSTTCFACKRIIIHGWNEDKDVISSHSNRNEPTQPKLLNSHLDPQINHRDNKTTSAKMYRTRHSLCLYLALLRQKRKKPEKPKTSAKKEAFCRQTDRQANEFSRFKAFNVE